MGADAVLSGLSSQARDARVCPLRIMPGQSHQRRREGQTMPNSQPALTEHRDAAAELLLRSFDEEFDSDETYRETIEAIARLLAAGRPVVIVRQSENEIAIISPKQRT